MPILIQGQYLQHIIFSLQDWQAKMQQPYTIPAPGTLLRYDTDFDGSSDSLFLAQLAQQTTLELPELAEAQKNYSGI